MLRRFLFAAAAALLALPAGGACAQNRSDGASAQVSVGTAPTLVAARRPGRQVVVVTVDAATRCAFGFTSSLSLASGLPLQPVAGATLSLPYAGPLWGVCANAATPVAVAEVF